MDAGRLWLDRVSSTNTVATWLAEVGWRQRLWVIARHQTAGVGRRGSRWESPAGGLWCSLLLPGVDIAGSTAMSPATDPPDANRGSRTSVAPITPQWGLDWLPLLMAAAVAATAQTLCGLPASLKWPNDVMVRGRKLAGVLASAQMVAGRLQHVVIGVGVNVNVDLATLPVELRPLVTSVQAQTGRPWPLDLWLSHLEQAWWPLYELWRGGERSQLRHLLMDRWFVPGQPVLVLPKVPEPHRSATLAEPWGGTPAKRVDLSRGAEVPLSSTAAISPLGPLLAQLEGLDERGWAVVWSNDQRLVLDPNRQTLRLLNLINPKAKSSTPVPVIR
ncbi:MAG: hypothetical protein IMX01_06840 [Limnochordaceae bacterium]|nr:hypothetical protein [Limnochordaceae bacterium]